jgi:hypothetical protein
MILAEICPMHTLSTIRHLPPFYDVFQEHTANCMQEHSARYGPVALAEDQGLNRQTTSRWANGENAPDFYWLYRLAFHFKRDLAEVFSTVGKAIPDSKLDSLLARLYNA